MCPAAELGVHHLSVSWGQVVAADAQGGREQAAEGKVEAAADAPVSAKARRMIAAALSTKHTVTLTVSGVASVKGMKPGTARVTIRLLA